VPAASRPEWPRNFTLIKWDVSVIVRVFLRVMAASACVSVQSHVLLMSSLGFLIIDSPLPSYRVTCWNSPQGGSAYLNNGDYA
jgi:hypothetical protein